MSVPGVDAPVTGSITVSKLVAGASSPEPVYTLSLNQVMAGWTNADGTWGCTSGTSWSPDFSKLLVSAKPPGASGNHIAVINLRDGSLTDLTQPRQKSGFSDAVLEERNPRFISDEPTDRVTPGDNTVLFDGNDNRLLQTSLADPSVAKSVKTVLYGGHPIAAGPR